MPSPFVWDKASSKYRDTRTGRYLSQQQVVGLRDAFTDALNDRAAELARRVAAGEQTAAQWLKQARADVKTAYLDQYMLGRGGRNAMSKADFGRVGQMVRTQYDYLAKFAAALDGLSEAQIRARLQLYMEGSTAAFERGYAQGALGMPQLEKYPGSGQTPCLSNCRCSLLTETTDGGWDVTWVLGAVDKHCKGCLEMAGKWNPLQVKRKAAA